MFNPSLLPLKQKAKRSDQGSYNKSKDCDKWSMLGVATAISGKRQEMDSALARPTPTSQDFYYNI